jgi:large subunit ribosomal protein L29
MVTAAEVSEYDTEELERQLSDTRRELFNLRFQLATGQLDNFSRINHVRKDVARMMTELRTREIAEAEGMAMEELPAHQAAARLRSEDEALGRTRTTAGERRAAARAEAEAQAEVERDDTDDQYDDGADEDAGAEGVIDEDELADEVADDDGMPVAEGLDEADDVDADDTAADEPEEES